VRAVAAWAAAVNATGGLNCHPVKYIIEDDGGDPSRNQALTQQLVEQDHVIALVHVDAPLADKERSTISPSEGSRPSGAKQAAPGSTPARSTFPRFPPEISISRAPSARSVTSLSPRVKRRSVR
jgi:hypothetical protein